MRLTHTERVEAAIPLLTRKVVVSLLVGTKGHRKGSEVGVSLDILRRAASMCHRIGRLTNEDVLPTKKKEKRDAKV